MGTRPPMSEKNGHTHITGNTGHTHITGNTGHTHITGNNTPYVVHIYCTITNNTTMELHVVATFSTSVVLVKRLHF